MPLFNGRAPRFKYEHIASDLAEEVATTFSAGDRFHSELDLVARHDTTRETVRKAIDLLVDQGLLERRGRAGTYVCDDRSSHAQPTFDAGLLCAALPVRGHLWDRLALSLASASAKGERSVQICDLSSSTQPEDASRTAPADICIARLQRCLEYRPRTLVVHDLRPLGRLNGLRESFRHLIVLGPAPSSAFDHLAVVRPEPTVAMQVAGRHARDAGYLRVALILPPGATNVCAYQETLQEASGGSFSLDKQMLYFEHHPDWHEKLRNELRGTGQPTAVISTYDWGVHRALEFLRPAGIEIPEKVGLIGMNNTPWALQDGLTSVYHDPDAWADEILHADAMLAKGEGFVERLLSPSIAVRGSTQRGQ